MITGRERERRGTGRDRQREEGAPEGRNYGETEWRGLSGRTLKRG